MAERQIGVGLVGFGLGGRVFHAPFVSAVPGLRLAAIMQRNRDGAAEAYTTARICRTLAELLEDRAVELVVVSTPNETHFPIAKQALEAGKHVVVDKPFASSSGQARELAAFACERRLHVIPFQNRRWDGDFLTVRGIVHSRELGRLVTFQSRMDRYRPAARQTWKETQNPANGLLFDLGPHLLDQLLCLFGAPHTITASVRSDRDTTAIDDAFDLTLHYLQEDGREMLAQCGATYLACLPGPRFLLHGTGGSFEKRGVDPQEPALRAGAKVPNLNSGKAWLEESDRLWGRVAVAPDPAEPNLVVERRIRTQPGDYRGFYANVRDALLGAAALEVTAEDGIRVVRLLELARQSSEQRRTIDVNL